MARRLKLLFTPLLCGSFRPASEPAVSSEERHAARGTALKIVESCERSAAAERPCGRHDDLRIDRVSDRGQFSDRLDHEIE